MKDREKHGAIGIARGIMTGDTWTADPAKPSSRLDAGVKAVAEAMVGETARPPKA